MPEAASSNYSTRSWMQNVPMHMPAPKNTYENYMITDALAPVTGLLDHDQIQGRSGPLNLELFPDRFGYRTDAISVGDVARLDDLYRRVDFSQKQSGYSGSSFPSLGGQY